MNHVAAPPGATVVGKRRWDVGQQSPYFNYRGPGTKGVLHQMWYDDPESLLLKYQFAWTAGLRGTGPYTFDDLDTYGNKTHNTHAPAEAAAMWAALKKGFPRASQSATPNATAMSHGVAGINVTIAWSWDWSGFGNCKKESGTTIVPPTTSKFGTHMANCTDGGYRALTLYCAVGVGDGGGAGGSGDGTVTAHYVTSAGGFNTVEDGHTVSSGCSTVIDGGGQPEPDQGGKCCFA